MTVKAGMLPGDEFSFAEWKLAQNRPRTTPAELPVEIVELYAALLGACQKAGVPHVIAFDLQDGQRCLYDLLDMPENVSHQLLLARSAVVDDPQHKMVLMAHSLQSLDLTKFNL